MLARLVFDGDLEADGVAETWADLAALDLVPAVGLVKLIT